ncbi:MAG: class I SAM-dependent methyltransferase [Planctomycetales bacterium]|nr:class I SAM-dependent methyltransferase [Planctomycetales bacterium]
MIRKLFTRVIVASQLPRNPFPGEMLPLERLRLFQWACQFQPKTVLEVGTGVGGSTFYLSMALQRWNGVLHSCDPVRQPPVGFLRRFSGTLVYHPWKSEQLIDHLLRTQSIPDMIFFDGPEIPELALQDLRKLEPFLAPGCMFAMHDWSQPGGRNSRIVSIKASQLRPYMEQTDKWTLVDLLHGHSKNVWWTKRGYDSVGLCLYRYAGGTSAMTAAA